VLVVGRMRMVHDGRTIWADGVGKVSLDTCMLNNNIMVGTTFKPHFYTVANVSRIQKRFCRCMCKVLCICYKVRH